MLEPLDCITAVNRLLVGLGQILTAAVLLGVVALVAGLQHNEFASTAAVLALGFTTIGYALQLAIQTPRWRFVVLLAVGISWACGIIAVVALIFGGK